MNIHLYTHTKERFQKKLGYLKNYLRYSFRTTSTHSKLAILWASLKSKGLLRESEKKTLVREVFELQKDGGWKLADLGNWVKPEKRSQFASDGYATGYILYILGQMGYTKENPKIASGLKWLKNNREIEKKIGIKEKVSRKGFWQTNSLHYKSGYDFLSDAATAFAILALKHYE